MIARRPVTQALADMLGDATGKPVGVGSVPINPATGRPFPPPYTLLYSLGGTTGGPELADLHEDAYLDYQLTFVSGPYPAKTDSRGTVEQVEWLADKGRTAILARPPAGCGYLHELTVPGATCYRREITTEPGATNEPEDAIITYVIRCRLHLTPSA